MQLKVEKLVFGGYGLARTDNGIVFVEQVVPGEMVRADITGKTGGVPLAVVREIITPSPWRRKPPCKYAGVCGGCDWQHILYEHQLLCKKEIFVECLSRIGKINQLPDIEIISAQEWNYRIRAQLKIDRRKMCIGFFKKGSHEIVRIEKCLLLHSKINEILLGQDTFLQRIPPATEQIRVIATSDGSAVSEPVIEGKCISKANLYVRSSVFTVSGSSFFQGNGFLLEKLGLWAESSIGGNFLIDMFGGLGFFSVLLGKKFSHVLCIESDARLVGQAKNSFSSNGLTHIQAETSTAEAFFQNRSLKKDKPDCLIVDPPRAGLTPLVREGIGRMKPETIVYVSCNPSTQARDIGFMITKCGYSIHKIALFDLYPQTYHMETAVILKQG